MLCHVALVIRCLIHWFSPYVGVEFLGNEESTHGTICMCRYFTWFSICGPVYRLTCYAICCIIVFCGMICLSPGRHPVSFLKRCHIEFLTHNVDFDTLDCHVAENVEFFAN